jgi:hypothetical protein
MAQQQVTVTLSPVMNGNGSFNSWQMNVDGKLQAPGTYPPITVGSGNNADFTFTIENAQGQNITFASFLVPAGNKDVHHVSSPVSGATQVTFKDHNWNKGPIPYEILFNGAPKLDPIIINDGGGPSVYLAYGAEIAAGLGLLAGILLTLAFRAMRSRNPAQANHTPGG